MWCVLSRSHSLLSRNLIPRNLRETLKTPSALINHVAEAATQKCKYPHISSDLPLWHRTS